MPAVSVILPVYNGDAFLKEAIDSILQQTFTDFELIIINDGSTDGSEEIIQSYSDERIIHLKNDTNKGLIFSLNRAIDFSQGKWIARMDADDISLPERIKKQLEYVMENDSTFLATQVDLIDVNGLALPPWPADRHTRNSTEIKRHLLHDNCLAHPSVLGKAEIFKKYRYRRSQKYSEDYDLWLRLVADGFKIDKLNEPLLLHRILPTSATRFKKINVFLRLAKVKFRFAGYQLRKRKISGFTLRVMAYAFFDLIKASVKETKSLFSK